MAPKTSVFKHLALLTAISLVSPSPLPAKTLIGTLLARNASVVSIKVESVGLAEGPPDAYMEKSTGAVLLQRNIVPYVNAQYGAGIIVHKKGYIVTNAHLVQTANRITITLQNQNTYDATPVMLAADQDLALMRIDTAEVLTPIELRNSDQVNIQERIFTIGNSQYLKSTLSEGKVSGFVRRARQTPPYKEEIGFLQIDFDVYPGDSGSPVLDLEGRLIGLMAAKSESRPKESYAIPTNIISEVFKDYLV